MKIIFQGEELTLHAEGIVEWARHQMAIVSDLHLEKGSHFALRGFFLPPYDSQTTLERLIAFCREKTIKTLLVLGDCFHDAKGYERLRGKSYALFDELRNLNPIWIKGNHDKDFVPDGFTAYQDFTLDGLTFRHEARPGEIAEISGHFHPKAELTHKSALIARPCFVEDGNKLILPAFGAYTGGLSLRNPAISGLLQKPFRFYAMGRDRVYGFESGYL